MESLLRVTLDIYLDFVSVITHTTSLLKTYNLTPRLKVPPGCISYYVIVGFLTPWLNNLFK